MTQETRRRILVGLLRLGGGSTVIAFLAALLPVDWMAAIHERIGLGEFPRTAIVDYLARSVAVFYGFHGALLLFAASNPVRHRSVVRFLGVMNVTFGVLLLAIDLHAGMPMLWTAAEGPPVAAFGVVVLCLSRSL